jgi:hypothetical protein
LGDLCGYVSEVTYVSDIPYLRATANAMGRTYGKHLAKELINVASSKGVRIHSEKPAIGERWELLPGGK